MHSKESPFLLSSYLWCNLAWFVDTTFRPDSVYLLGIRAGVTEPFVRIASSGWSISHERVVGYRAGGSEMISFLLRLDLIPFADQRESDRA